MLTIYESIILFKVLPKDELAACMKRAAGFIFSKGGLVRKIEYLGLQRCPYRLSKNRNPFWEAQYTFYEFQAPKIKVPDIYNEMTRDNDIIKQSFIPIHYPEKSIPFEECTFEKEMAIVPERPQVKEYVERAKFLKKRKTFGKVYPNTNLDYHPFLK